MKLETATAIAAAQLAQSLADSREGAVNITSKGGIDLVTATDLACEERIRGELHRAFPGYAVVGEERPEQPSAGMPYWLVDPICGTRPFASDVPLYCTNIALVENGGVTVAAIGLGRTGEVLYAEKDRGAWLRKAGRDTALAVSARSDTIWIDGSTERAADALKRAIMLKRWYVWKFSSSISYAYLAAGRIGGIVQFSGRSPYGSVHSAAGCFVAAQAGALTADLDTSGPWTLASRSFVIAANAELQRQLIDLCAAGSSQRPRESGEDTSKSE
jgi:myo-inositol-1(or 4)-monophosphatase